MPAIAPYGSWRTPITAELLTRGSMEAELFVYSATLGFTPG